MRAAEGSPWRGPLLLLLGLFLLRCLFLLAALDPIEERVMEIFDRSETPWAHGPERPLYDREELYTGTAAVAIGMGLDLPLSLYRFMPYGNGSLLVALLAVPIYKALGPHYLAFKIIPLAVSLLGALFWFLTVRLWLGKRTAWAFALLYAFAPTVLVRTALIAKGDHAEAMMLIGCVLYLASRATLASTQRARERWALCSGVLIGLGVFVTYSTLPTTAGTLLIAALLSRLRPLRVWLIGALGLLIGLVPYSVNLIATSGHALEVYGTTVGSGISLARAVDLLALLVNRGLLAGYDLPGGAAARGGAGLIWMLAVAAGWVALIKSAKRPAALLILGGTLAHIAAFCLLAPDPSSRYLVPGYPLFLLAAVFPVSGLWRAGDSSARHRTGPRGWWTGVAVAVLIGILAQVSVISGSTYRSLRFPLHGTDWPLLGEIAGQKLPPDTIARLPRPVQRHFWLGYGKRVAKLVGQDNWVAAAALVAEDERAAVWDGIGLGCVQFGQVIEAADYLKTLPEPQRTAYAAGLARHAEVLFAPLMTRGRGQAARGLLQRFSPRDRRDLELPFARVLATLEVHGTPVPEDVAAILSPEVRERGLGWALYRGIGSQGLRFWPLCETAWIRQAAAGLPAAEASPAVWRGLADALERDLNQTPPTWRVGAGDRPGKMAAELESALRELPESARALLEDAAERSRADARQSPDLILSW
jgi:hypothetical protein